MKNRLFIIFLSLVFSISLFAQKKESTTQFWVSGGIGQSVSDAFTKRPGLVAGTGFSFSAKQQMISLQKNQFWEPNRHQEIQGEFNEWKIQYGFINTDKRNQFFVTSGLSFTECNHFKEVFYENGMSIQKEPTTATAFGFVVESGINFVLKKHMGIGISTFANFNKNALTAGYRINLLLGLFKR